MKGNQQKWFGDNRIKNIVATVEYTKFISFMCREPPICIIEICSGSNFLQKACSGVLFSSRLRFMQGSRVSLSYQKFVESVEQYVYLFEQSESPVSSV
jgi:hypothetical protein